MTLSNYVMSAALVVCKWTLIHDDDGPLLTRHASIHNIRCLVCVYLQNENENLYSSQIVENSRK